MDRFVCPDCGYVYDEAKGDVHEGYAPGTPFARLPDDFVCPDCAVRAKEDFVRQGAHAAE
jgi:rubredoxin